MKRAMIISPTGTPLPLTADTLVEAAQQHWPGRVNVLGPGERVKAALTIDVNPVGEPGFLIDLSSTGASIRLDGTPEQNVETAAWLRSLMPADAPRIIVCDQAWSMHAELPSGVTADKIRTTIVDHSTPGWDANDPALRG